MFQQINIERYLYGEEVILGVSPPKGFSLELFYLLPKYSPIMYNLFPFISGLNLEALF